MFIPYKENYVINYVVDKIKLDPPREYSKEELDCHRRWKEYDRIQRELDLKVKAERKEARKKRIQNFFLCKLFVKLASLIKQL